jgi:hypothetical protein
MDMRDKQRTDLWDINIHTPQMLQDMLRIYACINEKSVLSVAKEIAIATTSTRYTIKYKIIHPLNFTQFAKLMKKIQVSR